MNISTQDRYRGALLGTLTADALGAPYEHNVLPVDIERDVLARGGSVPSEYTPFDYNSPWPKEPGMVAKGQPTDDSELAAALALSLVEFPDFNANDMYQRLRGYIHGRKSVLTTRAYGSGSTLRDALKLETYEESVALFAQEKIQTPPSNGSLMRAIGVPLRGYADMNQIIVLAEKQSMLTHQNPLAVAACVAYSCFVGFVLGGVSLESAWEATKALVGRSKFKDDAAMQEVLAIKITKPDFETEIKPTEGFVVLSLRVALWASFTSQSFAEGIIKAISIGGDTDTYGAIAGGILGAHYGVQGIPANWLSVMQGTQVMTDIADRLCGYR